MDSSIATDHRCDLLPHHQRHPAKDRQADSHRGGRLRVAAAVAAGARAGLAAGGAAVSNLTILTLDEVMLMSEE